jgi:hypothetical protein
MLFSRHDYAIIHASPSMIIDFLSAFRRHCHFSPPRHADIAADAIIFAFYADYADYFR